MNHRLLRTTALALCLLTSLAAAQGKGQGRPGKEPGAKPKAALAGTPTPEGGQLEFAVTGLTPQNATQVTASLKALTFEAFVCEACKVRMPAAGECPKCQAELTTLKQPMFAVAAAEGSSVRLAFLGGTPVHYSDLEKALGQSSVAIDAKHFPLTGRLQLHLKGGSEQGVAAVQKKLEDSTLFEDVRATFDPASGEIRCMVRPNQGATLAALREALGTSPVTLADLSWGGGGKRAGKRAGKGPGGPRGKGKDKDEDDD